MDGDDRDESAQTPMAEYLLAGSPRAGHPMASPAASPGVAASPSTARDGEMFTLRSPLDGRHRLPPVSPPAAEAKAGDDDPNDLTSRAFERQLVDAIVDSPRGGLTDIHEVETAAEDSRVVDVVDGTPSAAGGDDDGAAAVYRRVHINDPAANAPFGYCNNLVVTSRFTVYNFIPKLLFYEFSKLANAYFLVISIMQTIKPISNTGGFPASLPALSIIVLIDMFFACLEDYKRHKADHIANELPCRQFDATSASFVPSKWQLLHVGDIVKVHNREPVPADLVILGAWEPEPANPAGICYVETKSLDGETNLKLRQGLEATYTRLTCDADVRDLAGVVVCERPNNAIHRFHGTLTLRDGKKEVITTNAILLRGSTLRNTEYIYGLVVNTGPDTKIMMASSDAPIKWSNMEKRLNKQITYICTLMVVLCLTGAILSTIWNASHLSKDPSVGAWYLYDANATAIKAPVGNFFIQVLYYFLLLNSFIPVSLYVSMTSVKFMQAYFMNQDLEMYHAESDTPCSVRTMSLNEELGQIDYIFSDKTGTLTCNVMEFRKCSINGIAYGHGETEVGIAARKRRQAEEATTVVPPPPKTITEEREDEVETDANHTHRVVQAPFVNYQDDAIFEALALDDKHAKTIQTFFEHLAVCHTVMPERAADGSVRLSASSPDEQALVAAAACFGYKFCARSPGRAFVDCFSCLPAPVDAEKSVDPSPPPTTTGEYEVLEVLEFNSTRKRMSVIMRGPHGELKLLCKGADTVMYERLRETTDPHELFVRNQTLQHMETFANEGLRTLVIASTDVDPAFYENWVGRYRTAINDMRQIELRRLGEPNDIDRCMEEIEVDLEVLGATAIEDRLQSEVPDTIHKLREASIKIWMLTGDKEETAINIGFACRLLTSDIERVVISADTHPDLAAIMDELERYSEPEEDETTTQRRGRAPTRTGARDDDSGSTGGDCADDLRPLTRIESIACIRETQEGLALVIDGETLELALDECPMLFLSVALKCVAVIACRVSPAQKAQLVRLVRDNNPKVRTLAIGDGANDVSMIQSAHVGVGISGQEGMQAANSSDYAIAQFRFLARLLLVHGRWNYIRMGKLILYIFYKNVMMNLTQFWYMIFTGFSGQKFFLEWGLQGYNLIFTALPIVLISTFEQDVPARYAANYPVLYRVGQENSHFNTKIVWAWITSCAWESIVISFGTIYGMRYLVATGETPTMWVYGCVAFTIVVLVVTLKLCLHQQMWWPVHVAIYVCSYALWIATAAFISYGKSVSSAYWNGVFTNVFGTKVFWLLVPLIAFTALSRDLLWKGFIRAFRPSYKHLAQEVHAFGLGHLASYLLAFPPPESIPRTDAEAGAGAVEPKSPKKPKRKLTKGVSSGGGGGGLLGASRKSFTRGSAFSYDAESVMVESFMATERYQPHDENRPPVFERHASRGSMAFHSFIGGGGKDGMMLALASGRSAPVPTTTTTTTPLSGEDLLPNSDRGPQRARQHSAGNIFRGARHSLGRRRFFSVLGTTNDAAGSPANEDLGDSARRRQVRRSRCVSGDDTRSTSVTAQDPGIGDPHAHRVRRYTAHGGGPHSAMRMNRQLSA